MVRTRVMCFRLSAALAAVLILVAAGCRKEESSGPGQDPANQGAGSATQAAGPSAPPKRSKIRSEALWRSYLASAEKAYHAGDLPEAERLSLLAQKEANEAQATDYHIAKIPNILGVVYMDQGKLEAAEPLLKQSLAIWEKEFGADDTRVATFLDNLGILYHKQKKYDKAEPFFKRELAIYEKAGVADDPGVARALENYGNLLKWMGREEEAQPLLKRAAAIRAKSKLQGLGRMPGRIPLLV